jgi:hypothetical protein
MRLTCYQCDNQWNRRFDRDPVTCPKCGKDWHRPTLKSRLDCAIRAFVESGKPKGYTPRQSTKDKAIHKAEMKARAPIDAGQVY